jgi:hypothetical protein
MPIDSNTSHDLYILDQSCHTPSWLFCFIGGVYQENHWPAASLTNLINNVVSSNKGVLIADIYIRTTVYINLKNIPHSPRGNQMNNK